MAQYLIYRVGSNAANQPCTFDPVPIAIVEASSQEAAAETTWGDREISVHDCPTLAAEVIHFGDDLDVWSNQHVYAVPEAEAPAEDWNAVLEADLQREEDIELGGACDMFTDGRIPDVGCWDLPVDGLVYSDGIGSDVYILRQDD